MTTIAWFNCFSGIAGDMTLGALVDAGAPLDGIAEICGELDVGGWELEREDVLRAGIGATKVHVRIEQDHVNDRAHGRRAAEILAVIGAASLPERVAQRATAVFQRLAEVEAHIHRCPVDDVHFHEVGAVDAIIDIVGSSAGLELLAVDTITTSPISLGVGMARAAHGVVPNPAPASVALLEGIPVRGLDVQHELTTPTGAAMVATLGSGHGPMPTMTIRRSGFGAGDADFDDRANVVQVVIGEATASSADAAHEVMLLETNLDDVTGEVLAVAIDDLLAAGALDAWVTSAVMKKGRPGQVLSVLVDVARANALVRLIMASTGSLGVRAQATRRWLSSRHFDTVLVDGHEIRMKVGPHGAKAELDDARRVADLIDRPLRDVIELALHVWQTQGQVERSPGDS